MARRVASSAAELMVPAAASVARSAAPSGVHPDRSTPRLAPGCPRRNRTEQPAQSDRDRERRDECADGDPEPVPLRTVGERHPEPREEADDHDADQPREGQQDGIRRPCDGRIVTCRRRGHPAGRQRQRRRRVYSPDRSASAHWSSGLPRPDATRPEVASAAGSRTLAARLSGAQILPDRGVPGSTAPLDVTVRRGSGRSRRGTRASDRKRQCESPPNLTVGLQSRVRSAGPRSGRSHGSRRRPGCPRGASPRHSG